MKRIFFVNGYTRGCKPLEPYWTEKGTQFLEAAKNYFGGTCVSDFVNGEGPWYSRANARFKKGQAYARQFLETNPTMAPHDGTLCFVTHSMGAAFAEGMIAVLVKAGFTIEKIVHFAPADATNLSIPLATRSLSRVQLNLVGDKTLSNIKHPFTHFLSFHIEAVHLYGMACTDVKMLHPSVSPKDQRNWDFHYDTKTFAYVWTYLQRLEELAEQVPPNSSQIALNKDKAPVFKALAFHGITYKLDENTSRGAKLNYLAVARKRRCF
jgi:hypothetical protein